jgi:hypothetical protein
MGFCTSEAPTKYQSQRLGFQPRTCGNLTYRSLLFYHYAISTREILCFPKHYQLWFFSNFLVFHHILANFWQKNSVTLFRPSYMKHKDSFLPLPWKTRTEKSMCPSLVLIGGAMPNLFTKNRFGAKNGYLTPYKDAIAHKFPPIFQRSHCCFFVLS